MFKRVVAVAIALLMVLLAMWTIVPAPTIPTLGLAVGIPELALPVSALFAAIALGLVFLVRGTARVVVVALWLVALGCLAVPLVRVPATWTDSNARLNASGIAPLRAHPLVEFDETHDIAVPLRDGSRLALDLYRPRGTVNAPVIVTIYGGAWQFGSRSAEAPLARFYAARGYAVAVIDYRHAPAYRFPVQIDDVDDALNAIGSHADAWHIDITRVALFGRSAGAQLALLAGERTQLIRVRAIVAYYAPSDLIGGWNDPPHPDPAGVRALIETYLGGPPDAAHVALYRAAAPLSNAHAGMPPVLAIIGDRDALVEPVFQRNFAARLDALRVRNVAIELPWSNHAFDSVDGLGASIAHTATLRFLDTLLR